MVVASTTLITALKQVKHDAFCGRFATVRSRGSIVPELERRDLARSRQ
jgi:hypothetical protein